MFSLLIVFQIKLVSRIHICLLDEPGAPEITGYRDNEIIRAGDQKELVCRSRGGNPVPQVNWLKNGVLIDHSFSTHNDFALNAHVFTVDQSDNLIDYECQVSNVMTSLPKSTNFRFTVNC